MALLTHLLSGLLVFVSLMKKKRLTNTTVRWRRIFDELVKHRGKKKAIVAIARRLLCVMASMLQSGRGYQAAMV